MRKKCRLGVWPRGFLCWICWVKIKRKSLRRCANGISLRICWSLSKELRILWLMNPKKWGSQKDTILNLSTQVWKLLKWIHKKPAIKSSGIYKFLWRTYPITTLTTYRWSTVPSNSGIQQSFMRNSWSFYPAKTAKFWSVRATIRFTCCSRMNRWLTFSLLRLRRTFRWTKLTQFSM